MSRFRPISALETLSLALVAAVLAIAPVAAAEGTSAAFLGKEAPAFTLPDASGTPHSLASLRGQKGTVIIWVSTQCPVSNSYNERMEALATKYQAEGYKFVGINSNKAETPEEIAKHSKEHGFTFPVLKDDGNKIADLYGASVTPEVYVVDASGVLRYHGRIDDSMKPAGVTTKDLDEALAALGAGKDLKKAESKAFGCTIKRVAKAGA